MAYDALNDSLSDFWGASLEVGSGGTYLPGKTAETIPQNAAQSMTPVTSDVITPEWSSFLKDAASGLLSYAVRRDAAKNGVPEAANTPAQAQQQRSTLNLGPIVMLAGVGLFAFVVIKLAK